MRPFVLADRLAEFLSSGTASAELESVLVLAVFEAILLKMSTLLPVLVGRHEADDKGLEIEAVVFEPGRVLDDIVDDVEAVEGD